MNKKILSVALMTVTLLSATAKNDDPTLMTINGKKVSLSEFEYLYKKNNSQQLQPQTLDEYVDMFVTYKLKVADAEAAGIDTTQAFINEYNGYRDELARPYLRDSSVEDSLINVSYERMKEDVDVSHVMVRFSSDPKIAARQTALLDSLRTEIINGADFGAIADKHSIDPGVKYNHGHMGWMSANRYPFTFETVAYGLKVGEISPVMATPFGFHIIKLHARRPSRGEVYVQHILKMVSPNAPEDLAARKQAEMDSIYNLLKSGADFSELAKKESEDGSARNGGELPWFGAGQMVAEFEDVAFALENGAISEPFKTRFGIHIVRKIDSRSVKPLEEARKEIMNMMIRDERGTMADEVRLAQLKQEHNSEIVASTYDKVKASIEANNGLDSALIKTYIDSKLPIVNVGGEQVALSVAMKKMSRTRLPQNLKEALGTLEQVTEKVLDEATLECEKKCLAEKYPEFRNLTNEYRDGMLLFEISNRKVWDRASKDKAGLEEYFQNNKSKYTWAAPKYKGFIIHATNDSIKGAVDAYLAGKTIEADSVARVLREEFGKAVKVDRVIAAKGENAIVDNIAFGGEAPKISGKWQYHTTYMDKVIDAPEEAADVRGQVTSDYQNHLEAIWVKELRTKYPWKLNKKELKKIK